MNALDSIIKSIDGLEKRIGRLEVRNHYHPILNLGAPTILTIAGGIVTRVRSNHRLAGQGGAADDLDTINGGVEGDLLILRASNSAVTITLKDGTGNIRMPADMTLDHADDVELLYFDGTNWLEITGSSNT